ncbi:MAG: hypothetical protein HYV92_06380 [Candidatus Rokubacteria bacterium]|nr:hypothetical protein [Candidatus Rokubacteria bacterium]MBI2554040.1 hypothetical protein [Candidatus Rokubacteria bacterium]
MKAHAVLRSGATAGALIGKVLCHDVRDGAKKVVGQKGETLDGVLAERILGCDWEELHLLELEPGDLHEEEAGARLSRAVVGDGVQVKGYTGGQWALTAARRGLLKVRTGPLSKANAFEGISVFTLFDGQPVEAGEVVAKAKVTPLVIASATIAEVERLARQAGGVLAVSPFTPFVIGAVARERLEEQQRRRFESALQEKIDWFGSRLLPIRFAGMGPHAVAKELEALKDAGAQIFIVAGASALDPLDPVFGGLELVGGRMERHGSPAHPGSLLWIARWEGAPLVGMPTCGMFSQATTFDLVFPRILAGDEIGNAEIAALGHGGLLSREMAFRFPPYRATAPRGELE